MPRLTRPRSSNLVGWVFAGGGARGAYEVGVCTYLFDRIAAELGRPDHRLSSPLENLLSRDGEGFYGPRRRRSRAEKVTDAPLRSNRSPDSALSWSTHAPWLPRRHPALARR